MHKKSDKVVKGGKVMDEFKDETLSCRDCSEDFVFTEGEQEFYNSKGWENKPTRCEACKNAKKARFGEDKPKCYAYERGECSRGDQCKFSHGTEKTFGGGGGGGGGGGAGAPVCYANQRGECTRGDSCKFSHEEGGGGGSRPPSRGGRESGGGGGGGGGVCFSFLKGECSRGDQCRFTHDKNAAALKASGTCYAFQEGKCDRGDACRFQHN